MVAGKFQGAFISVLDTHFGQTCGHVMGALAATTPCLCQTGVEGSVVGIKAQAHNVDGLSDEGDRYFDPGQVMHALRSGGGGGALLPTNFVVVR